MSLKYKILYICLSFLFFQGCSNNSSIFSKDKLPLVHRINIQQGNVITQDMLAKLKLGMDKKKVRFVMGTPLITDTFHNDRWDYIYTYKEGREQREQRRITLFFTDDLLAKVDGNITPAHGKIQTDSPNVESVEVPPAEPKGVFSRVKEKLTFGDDDKPKVEQEIDEKKIDDTEPELENELETTPEDAIDDATETVEESSEEEKGFFGKMWDKSDEEPEIDPNDPTLTDPELNPSY